MLHLHGGDFRSARQAKALRIFVLQLPARFLLTGFAQLRLLMSPSRQQHVYKSIT